MNPELTVIIVSYNTCELTLKCIETLYATTKAARFRTVLLDNASSDGSADAVAEAFPQVAVIRSEENLGFGRATNIVAADAHTDWLLLLNPDTEVLPDAVDQLLAFAKANPQAGITGGRTIFPDGSLNGASCWNRITAWSAFCETTGLSRLCKGSKTFNPEGFGSWQRDTVRRVDIVGGAFFMIGRALWTELGGFDPKYFMYGEEADLCLRAARLGYQPMITPEAQIIHLGGSSNGNRADMIVRIAKARGTLIRDHWPAALVPFGLTCLWGWGAGRRSVSGFLKLLPGEKYKEAAAIWRSVWAARSVWLESY
jgi:hypothetical protein